MKCEVISYERAVTLLEQLPRDAGRVDFGEGDAYTGTHAELGVITLVVTTGEKSLLILPQ